MNIPALSVLMPVYNAERYLGEAIESVLAQTFDDFEFLIIDDGSSDGSAKIGETYAAHDPRIRFKSRENKGISETLNEMAAEARAPLLARMDADDICRPDRFEAQMAFLAKHPDVIALGTAVSCIDMDGRPIRDFDPHLVHEEITKVQIEKGQPGLWHPAVIMRRDAFLRVEGYSSDYPYTEDYDLWLKLGEVGRLANHPETLLKYRLHAASVSVKKRHVQIDAARRARRAALDRRGLTSDDLDAHADAAPNVADIYQKWAYWSQDAGYEPTARHYARLAFAAAPSLQTAKLLVNIFRPRLSRLT